jgi:hypothetical protein
MNQSMILKRVDELIARTTRTTNAASSATLSYEIYMGAITIAAQLYGSDSPQLLELKGEKQRIAESKWNENSKFDVLLHELKGILASFRADIVNGLVERLEVEARGEIYSSLITIAKDCLEKHAKDAAAVLVTAALEDALKKFALSHGADVDNYDMSAVISKLKTMSLLHAPEAKIVQSYVTLRNKAMHAQWDKIGEPEIASAIGFVERFVLTRFISESAGKIGAELPPAN